MTEPIAPAKKGLSTGAKIAIGCLVIVVLFFGACFAVGGYGIFKLKQFVGEAEENPDAAAVRLAALAFRANPDIDVVSSDPAAGKITVRDKKSGKEVTFDLEDIKAGRLTIESGDEKVEFNADAPDGGDAGGFTISSDKGKVVFGADSGSVPQFVPIYPGARSDNFSSIEAAGERSGTFTIHTADSPDQVIAFYESELEASGFKIEKVSLEAGSVFRNLTATAGNRTVNVGLSAQEGQTQGLVAYADKP